MRVVVVTSLAVMAWASDPAQAEYQIRINDGQWVEREVSRFAASLGHDPVPFRRIVAERLYRCRELSGIDMLRPAYLWWATEGGPMAALVPVSDRRKFSDAFGVDQPPIVRVSEREGTAVFTQNLPTGLREYRLQVVEEVAVIGRNVDEINRLIPRIPDLLVTDPNLPAIEVTLRGAALRRALQEPALWPLPRLPASGLDPRPALAALGGWLGKEATVMTLQVRALGATHARLTIQLRARPDGDLAAWIASQQATSTRIAGLIEGPTTALVVNARANWGGRLESMGESLGPLQGNGFGAGWTPSVDESWRQVWRLAERVGEVALALDENPESGWTATGICEQPRATEQLVHLHALATAATGDPGRSGEVSGLPVVLRTVSGRTEATAAGTRHLVTVSATGRAGAQAPQAAAQLAANAAQVMPPRGTPGILALKGDLGRLVRLVPGANREADPVPAPVTANLTVRPGAILQFEATVPLEASAKALARLPTGFW